MSYSKEDVVKLPLKERAKAFATVAHIGQKRKYSDADYIVHPIRVAEHVQSLGSSDEMIAAAYLHDTIEDCGIKKEEINEMFGEKVANLVDELTDKHMDERDEKGVKLLRKVRRAKEDARLAKISDEAKIIKICDVIDNLSDMGGQKAWGFRKKFAAEKLELLKVIGNIPQELREKAYNLATL
jgi:(p)ppGpp synthase/HD superfamily hydrolase